MISMNASDVVTADVVKEIWDICKTKYKNTAILNDIQIQRAHLEEGGETNQFRLPFEKKESVV